MQSVQVQITTEQLFEAVKQLPEKERRKLRKHLDESPANVKPQRNGYRRPTTKEIETELLIRIHFYSHLPSKVQRRFNQLRRKKQAETISDSELTELQGLWSRIEWMSVERLEALIELAKLRGTDYKTLMHELGLDKKRNVF